MNCHPDRTVWMYDDDGHTTRPKSANIRINGTPLYVKQCIIFIPVYVYVCTCVNKQPRICRINTNTIIAINVSACMHLENTGQSRAYRVYQRMIYKVSEQWDGIRNGFPHNTFRF